jgi:hypothetical protein
LFKLKAGEARAGATALFKGEFEQKIVFRDDQKI